MLILFVANVLCAGLALAVFGAGICEMFCKPTKLEAREELIWTLRASFMIATAVPLGWLWIIIGVRRWWKKLPRTPEDRTTNLSGNSEMKW